MPFEREPKFYLNIPHLPQPRIVRQSSEDCSGLLRIQREISVLAGHHPATGLVRDFPQDRWMGFRLRSLSSGELIL